MQKRAGLKDRQTAKRPPETLPEVAEEEFGGKLGQTEGGPAPVGLVTRPGACTVRHASRGTAGRGKGGSGGCPAGLLWKVTDGSGRLVNVAPTLRPDGQTMRVRL